MELNLEWIIPFIILGAMFLPRFIKGVPNDVLNEFTVLLVTCLLIGIVISVIRHVNKLNE